MWTLILKIAVFMLIFELVTLPFRIGKIALKALHSKWKSFKATLEDLSSTNPDQKILVTHIYGFRRY